METGPQDSIPDRPPPLRRSTRIQKRDEKRRYEELERKEMESRKSI
ncbi:24711_t:CDS:1, partial [Entrophospora sp. SA101]